MLTLTPRVLGTYYCVLLLQVLCMIKKLIGGVKRAFSSGPFSRGSGLHSSDGSQDSARSSSFMPSPHETRGAIRYLAHDDVPMAMDGDDISIRSTEEMQKYESLRHWEFGHTRVYDVNLLKRVGMDEELPLILRTIGWGKLYGGDRTTRATNGWHCNHANGNASIPRLTNQHDAWPLWSLQELTLMLESSKDLSLGEMSGAQVWVHSQIFQLSCHLSHWLYHCRCLDC
jgi:hypothetical protein